MSLSALDKTGLARFWSKVKAYVNHENVINAIGYTPANTSVATKTANGLLPMLPNDDDGNKFMRQDGRWQRVTTDNIAGGFLQIHPSAYNGFILPYLNNDLAFLRAKGGSYIVKYDGVEQTDIIWNADRVFDAGYTFFNIQQPSMTEIVFEITTPQIYKWGSKIYIDFGDPAFGCKGIVIEARQAGSDTWETFYTTTTNTAPYIVFSKTFYAGTGIDGLRITFSDWTTPSSQFALAQIGLINYTSVGPKSIYIPVNGGDVYGPIVPNLYGTVEFGSSARYWKNIYTKKVTLDADPVNPLEAATKQYVDNAVAAAGGVSSYIVELDSYSWTNNTQTITVPGVTATNLVIISPVSSSINDYRRYGIEIVSQSTNSVTFICTSLPYTDISLILVILDSTPTDLRLITPDITVMCLSGDYAHDTEDPTGYPFEVIESHNEPSIMISKNGTVTCSVTTSSPGNIYCTDSSHRLSGSYNSNTGILTIKSNGNQWTDARIHQMHIVQKASGNYKERIFTFAVNATDYT